MTIHSLNLSTTNDRRLTWSSHPSRFLSAAPTGTTWTLAALCLGVLMAL